MLSAYVNVNVFMHHVTYNGYFYLLSNYYVVVLRGKEGVRGLVRNITKRRQREGVEMVRKARDMNRQFEETR